MVESEPMNVLWVYLSRCLRFDFLFAEKATVSVRDYGRKWTMNVLWDLYAWDLIFFFAEKASLSLTDRSLSLTIIEIGIYSPAYCYIFAEKATVSVRDHGRKWTNECALSLSITILEIWFFLCRKSLRLCLRSWQTVNQWTCSALTCHLAPEGTASWSSRTTKGAWWSGMWRRGNPWKRVTGKAEEN